MRDQAEYVASRAGLTASLPLESLTTSGQLELSGGASNQSAGRGMVAQDVLFTEQGAAYWALTEVARLQRDDLPFLAEVVTRTVVPRTSDGKRSDTGVAAVGEAWEFAQAISISEINVFGAPSAQGQNRGEALLGHLIHGLAHVYNHWSGIKDTSNRGRYHNARFAATAQLLGLDVSLRDATVGFATAVIASEFHARYSHIIDVLNDSLALTSPSTVVDPLATVFAEAEAPAAEVETKSKYVFASCGCTNRRGAARTIRIASGSWQPSTIHCSICGQPFTTTQNPPSESDAGQHVLNASVRTAITH